MDEGGAPSIQNDFFNKVRREKQRVAVFLNNGKRLTGKIRSFDKFTILLDTGQGEQIIFKHAIATVGRSASSPSARSREGFNNRMELEVPHKAGEPAEKEDSRGQGENAASAQQGIGRSE